MFNLISLSFHIEQFLRLAQWLIYYIASLVIGCSLFL